MASFAGSTQQRHWHVSAARVAERRAAAVAGRAPASALTLDEEAALRRHHERRILRFATRVGFPRKVAATAITYFKRFYLDRSLLDYNPAVIALSSLYAASKVEEVIMPAEEMVARVDTVLNGIDDPVLNPAGQAATESVDGTATRVSLDMLLRDELNFLNHLNFHLVCFSPYRSFLAIADMLHRDPALPNLVKAPPYDPELTRGEPEPVPPRHAPTAPLDVLMDRAAHIATRRTFLTDLQFVHTPAVVACACVMVAAEELEAKAAQAAGKDSDAGAAKPRAIDIDAAAVAKSLLRSNARAELVIRETAATVRTLPEGGLVSDEDMRALEKRRRALCDPLKDPTSAAFKKRQAEQDEELDEKRRKKMQAKTADNKAKTEALMGFSG